MNNSATKTDRLDMPRQLRMDPTLSRQIRARADLSCRRIQDYLLFLIQLGLKHENECMVKAEDVGSRQFASEFVRQPYLPMSGGVSPRRVKSDRRKAGAA